MSRLFAAAAAAFLASLAPATAQEKWPERQVNVIVPFTAGGTTDMFGRIFAQHMQAKFGPPFIVENRAGAGGNIGTSAVAKAAPDGYTILIATVSTHAINPFLYTRLPHNTEKELRLVRRRHLDPSRLRAVPDDHRHEDDARALSQLGRRHELDRRRAHRPHLRQHDARLAAGAGRHRPRHRGDEPRAQPDGAGRAVGLGDVEGLRGDLVAPIRQQLAKEVGRIFELPEVKSRMVEIGAVPSPMTPDEFTAFIKAERDKWQEVVKTSGAKIE